MNKNNTTKPLSARMAISISIITILLSGIFAALVSNHLYKVNLEKQVKIDTFKRVFSYRYDFQSDEFRQALNEIFVIYNDSEQVIKALNNFHDTATSNNKNSANDDFLKLLKAMCREVDIDYSGVSDSFFLRPFNTK